MASLGSHFTHLTCCPKLFPFLPYPLPGGSPIPVSVLWHVTDQQTDRLTVPTTPQASVLWYATNQPTRYPKLHCNRSRSRSRTRNHYRTGSCYSYRTTSALLIATTAANTGTCCLLLLSLAQLAAACLLPL